PPATDRCCLSSGNARSIRYARAMAPRPESRGACLVHAPTPFGLDTIRGVPTLPLRLDWAIFYQAYNQLKMLGLRNTSAGLELDVHVQPGARRNAIVGTHAERLKVALQAPPVEGQANVALTHFM